MFFLTKAALGLHKVGMSVKRRLVGAHFYPHILRWEITITLLSLLHPLKDGNVSRGCQEVWDTSMHLDFLMDLMVIPDFFMLSNAMRVLMILSFNSTQESKCPKMSNYNFKVLQLCGWHCVAVVSAKQVRLKTCNNNLTCTNTNTMRK